jgi:hypothetical protein
MDWKEPSHSAGSDVKVSVIGEEEKGFQDGVLLNDYDANDEDQAIPEIRLADGQIVTGYECWWIPASEAKIVEQDLS